LETVTAVSVIYRDSFPEKYIGGMPPNWENRISEA
jgi:hypothetical protein